MFELADEDETSRAIVERGAGALAELTGTLARRLDLTTAPVVFAGGPIVHQELLQRLVRARLDELGVRDVRILGEDPVVGAARLAERLLAGRDA